MGPDNSNFDDLIAEEDVDGIHYYSPESYPAEKIEVGFTPWDELDDDGDDEDQDDNEDYREEEKRNESADKEEPGSEAAAETEEAAEGLEAAEGAEVAAETAEAIEGAEAAATAAETAEVAGAMASGEVGAAGGAGLLATVGPWILVAIVIILFVVIIAMALLGTSPDQASGLENSNCVTTDTGTLDLGSPKNGYYLLPKSSNYDLNVNGGSPRSQQWGGKTLIETINIVAALWNQKHPDERMGIGDLNAPGHASHKNGVDADIYSIDSIFMSLPGHANNPHYKQSLAIELGKLFADTDALDIVFYDDAKVVSEVNKYINSKKLAGKFSVLSQHDDHFHIRVKEGATPNGTACTEDNNPAVVEGDLAALQKTYKDYRKKGYIKTQSIGDPDGDIADGKVKAQTIRTLIQMADFLHSKDQYLELSVMVTGHGPGTLHEVGLAFDIGNEKVAKYLMPWAKQNAKDLSLDELIFDNTLIDKSANYYNLKGGKSFNYSRTTLNVHRNHIHVGVKD